MVMISSAEIQSAYVDLYTCLRNYIWDFRTVEYIAELEVMVYTTFPTMSDMRNKFNQLYMDVRDVCKRDEELDEACKAFQQIIDSDDIFYSKLDKVKEVITQ